MSSGVPSPHKEPELFHLYMADLDEALTLVRKEDYDGLLEQLETLAEHVREANKRVRQPIDLNYVALPKDDWEAILLRAPNPAREPS